MPYNAYYLTQYGWTTTFENRRCLCINSNQGLGAFGPEAFKRFPILIEYLHDGDQFLVSLYSDPESGINVEAIAKQRGGLGITTHAIFTCKTLPMIKEASYVAR